MSEPRRMGGRFALWFVAVFALYSLLADHPTDEEATGAVIALLCACAALALQRILQPPFHIGFAELARLRGVPRSMLLDCFTVARAILASFADPDALKGHTVEVPFEAGSDDDSDDISRRALVTYGISAAPNSIVCELSTDRLVVHQLRHATLPGDRRWPV